MLISCTLLNHSLIDPIAVGLADDHYVVSARIRYRKKIF